MVMKLIRKLAILSPLAMVSCGQPGSNTDLSAFALNFDSSVNCGGMAPSNTPDTYRICASLDAYDTTGRVTPTPAAWDFTGFPELQREKLRKATLFMLQALEKHSYQKSKTGTSDLEACAAKYTTKQIVPRNAHPAVVSSDVKFHVNQMVLDYQVNATNHRFHIKSPAVFLAFSLPPVASSDDPDVPVYTVAKVDDVLSNNLPGQEFTRGIRVHINTFAIEKFSEKEIGAAIFHEIMHLWGYQHPKDNANPKADSYTGTLIREVESCMTRGNLDKSSSLQKNPFLIVDEVGLSTSPASCIYKHKKDTKGGKKGQTNAFDVNGKQKSCDKNGDWKKSCKDGDNDTDEVACQ
jgi:hypothetical protein